MISFIVPAHNEARLLGETLVALHTAAKTAEADYDIVVVDDASTDATADIARHGNARVVPVELRHIAAVRNAGAQATTSDVLIFVDADTVVASDTVRAALEAIREGAVGGGATVRFPGRIVWHVRATIAFFGWLFRATRIAPGCFVFCTRAAFDAVGGFDETYYAAEDIAISRSLATQGRFVILRQRVFTSDRKLRTHSTMDHFRLILRFLLGGRRVLKSRHDLDLWYGTRRDP